MTAPIAQPAVWHGDELFARPDWRVELSAGDVAALVEGSRPPPKLARVRDALEHGTGAALLYGIEPGRFDLATLSGVFERLAGGIGTALSQSARGERLLHVRDAAYGADDARVRGPFTNRRLGFHTDRCDVIAFLCVRPARAGGENELVSAQAVYNELARRYPAELALLEQPYPILRHTVDTGNERAYTSVPIFSSCAGRFAVSYLRVLIERADASPHAPDLTAAQRGALDVLDAVLEEPGLRARFRLAAGDVLLVNNWVTLHRRLAFEDHEQEARRRHLLRIWLSVPNSRPLDPRFAAHFGATAAGALRGGMREQT